ncbi:hypothetical protein GGX14DRAFT_349309 [Mycena pura]|uniref:Fibronectin type-III domain-containing protein n=1 Tax=Mycena pura TaxID=153505 RepID=A0AAD7E347_9AGAR|nr:hypothetical protein GGX14DRAFT_349309 [Mycena pura]
MSRRPWWAATFLCSCAVVLASGSLGFLEQVRPFRRLPTVSYSPQSFFFDYNPASEAVPVPVTAQCETIHLTWSRGAGTGPDPTAPYYLQIYTSAFVFPFIVDAGSGLSFDWQVPFGPGTIYQICMFDKNGNTGGCQAMYTMIANTTATPSCNNVTFPLGPLDVDATVSSGPLSQYGWIDECTDIQVKPNNGTPPYIFTATLHPPRNITGTDLSPLNYTVNLSWGAPFFISVVDASMNFWSYGPLHSGQGSSLACLSGSNTFNSNRNGVSSVIAITSGVGGIIVGLAAGVAATFVFRHKRKRERGLLDRTGSGGDTSDPFPFHNLSSATSAHYMALPSKHAADVSTSRSPSASSMAMQRMQRESTHYQIEPFTPPSEVGGEYSAEQSRVRGTSPSIPGGGNIYVVHHDAGRPPVTVYHQDGVEVVELPPRYARDSTPSTAGNDGLSERQSVAGSATRRTSSSHSVPDILTPQRRPNRPGKP